MNYLKEAENYLLFYRHLKMSIEVLENQIQEIIKKSYPGMKRMMLESSGRVRKTHDAYNEVYTIQYLNTCKDETINSLERIDEVLEFISQDEDCQCYGKLLKCWYVGKETKLSDNRIRYVKIPKEEIAEIIGYSKKSRETIYEKKNEALKRFAITLFGVSPLEYL